MTRNSDQMVPFDIGQRGRVDDEVLPNHRRKRQHRGSTPSVGASRPTALSAAPVRMPQTVEAALKKVISAGHLHVGGRPNILVAYTRPMRESAERPLMCRREEIPQRDPQHWGRLAGSATHPSGQRLAAPRPFAICPL